MEVERATPPAPVEVRVVNPLEDSAWDERLLQFPQATVFHSAAWTRVLCETYGYLPFYLTAYQGENVVGALPLMEVKSRLTGTRGVSLPFSDFVPPLGLNPECAQALRDQALELARGRSWKYLELRGFGTHRHNPSAPNLGTPEPRNLLDRQSPEGEGGELETLSYCEHVLRLDRDSATLFDSFHSSVRRAVRKSEKSGLTAALDSTLASVKTFYRLNCLTRRTHGLPPQPWAFFQSLHRHVLARGHGFVVTARTNDIPVASSIFLQFGVNALYKYGASDRKYQELRGNNLAMWAGIRNFAQMGMDELSMGRTSLGNAGLRRFKGRWATDERQVPYHRFDPASGEPITHNATETGWHSRLFRRMPIPVSRLVGALLYRHMG